DRRATQAAARHREDADPTRPRASPRGGEDERMTHEPYDTLAATYAVGALDGQERADFERHLADGCDVCEAILRESAEALGARAVGGGGLGPGPEGSGRVVWHPVKGGYVFVANLPAAPPGMAYEIWTIGDGAPRPAGLFQVDPSKRGAHRIDPVEGGKPVKVFAVTLETSTGVPTPQGPMVLASAK